MATHHFSVDAFLDRMPSEHYNCFDFVAEVWAAMTGEDVRAKLTGLVGDFTERRANKTGVKSFQYLQGAIDPCFVVLQRRKLVPHVGIYLDGRMLHLHSKGAEFMPIDVAKRYYRTVKFYR